MLQSRGLTFSYDKHRSFSFPDIECKTGEQCLLLGESGSGKTTLLHVLGGLRKPTAGSVMVQEQDITKMTGAALDRFRGRHIGIIFQQSHFVTSLTIRENLQLAQKFANLPVDDEKILQILNRLNIGDRSEAKPQRLSVGEQQRASICRALINGPDLILADEPTSALDDSNCEEVVNLLQDQAAREGATLMIVTHDTRLKTRFSHQIELHS